MSILTLIHSACKCASVIRRAGATQLHRTLAVPVGWEPLANALSEPFEASAYPGEELGAIAMDRRLGCATQIAQPGCSRFALRALGSSSGSSAAFLRSRKHLTACSNTADGAPHCGGGGGGGSGGGGGGSSGRGSRIVPRLDPGSSEPTMELIEARRFGDEEDALIAFAAGTRLWLQEASRVALFSRAPAQQRQQRLAELVAWLSTSLVAALSIEQACTWDVCAQVVVLLHQSTDLSLSICLMAAAPPTCPACPFPHCREGASQPAHILGQQRLFWACLGSSCTLRHSFCCTLTRWAGGRAGRAGGAAMLAAQLAGLSCMD